jgi:hypothetical protein
MQRSVSSVAHSKVQIRKGQLMAALFLSLVMMTPYAIKPSTAHAAVLETTSLSRKGMDRCVPASRNNSLLP